MLMPQGNGALLLLLACTLAVAPSWVQSQMNMNMTSEKIQAMLQTSPSMLSAGRPFDLRVKFSSHGSSLPAFLFALGHTKLLHMVAMGSDLDTFLHTHPEDTASINPGATDFDFQKQVLPKAGRYYLAFDGDLTGGQAVSAAARLQVKGKPTMQRASKVLKARHNMKELEVRGLVLSPPMPAVSLADLRRAVTSSAVNVVGGTLSNRSYHVTLTGPVGSACVPGKAADYTWEVMDSSTMMPVTDLTLYLGAAMHVAAVSQDGSFFEHVHGLAASQGDMGSMQHARRLAPAADMFGPSVTATLALPRKGSYVLVGQLARGSDLILAPFYLTCTGKAAGAGKSPKHSPAMTGMHPPAMHGMPNGHM